jgi:hypothetical protein
MSPESVPLFLSAERADALAAWRSSEPNVVSLYLPVDAAGEYPAVLERMIREGRETDPLLRGLDGDLDAVARFVNETFEPGPRRGLCVLSCRKYGLFEAVALPEAPNPALIAAERPVLGPLSAVRRRHRRFLVLLANERRARFVECYLGESSEIENRAEGPSGQGPAALAARAEAVRRARRADLFVLGAPPPLQAALEPHLSDDLREELIPEPLLGPDRPNSVAADRVAHREREAAQVRQSVLVQRFLDDLERGAAVAGLEAAAAALQEGRAVALLVREGWAKMGRCCPGCGRLSVDHRSCPWCFKPTETVLDLVAELADRADAAGVEVVRVGPDPRFDSAGRIGVLLPEAAPKKEVPAGRALRGLFHMKDGAPSPLRPRPV